MSSNRPQSRAPGAAVAVGATGVVTAFLLAFMGAHEGTRYKPYQDVAVPGLWTVCRGITNRAAHGWVVPGKTYTEAECTAKEIEIIETKIAPVIDTCRKVRITQRQWEMLADFAWNIGTKATCESTLMRKLNAGDCYGAAGEFDRWVKAGGRKWPGLAARRDAEQGEFVAWCGKA